MKKINAKLVMAKRFLKKRKFLKFKLIKVLQMVKNIYSMAKLMNILTLNLVMSSSKCMKRNMQCSKEEEPTL